MAFDTAGFPGSQVTLAVKDFTSPTPVSVSITQLVGDVNVPLERPTDRTRIMVNSTSGKTHTGTALNGKAAPPTESFTFVAQDIGDNVETTSPLSLLLALSKSSVSGTPFSSSDHDSPLVLGGPLACSMLFSMVNQAASPVTHTVTFSAEIDSVVPAGMVDGFRAYTANYTIISEPVRA